MAIAINLVKKQMMTLYLGINLLVFGWTSNTEAFFPENIDKSIVRLHEHYLKHKTDQLYTGHPIFLGKLKVLHEKFEVSEQKLLMNIILDAYDRILTKMENETEDKTIKDDLKAVKDQLSKLKEHYYSGKHADLKSYISELLALKESDSLNQSKALFELKSVYRQATHLGDPSVQNHRRRRQAKNSKKQLPKMN